MSHFCKVKTGKELAIILFQEINMKSMFILTDFSEGAFRAAEYACELAGSLHVGRIVLLHAYRPVMAYGGALEAAPIGGSDQEDYLESMKTLALWQDRLKPMVAKDVRIELVAEGGGITGLPDWIDQLSDKEEVGIIVMGVSRKSGLENFLMGSVTKEILKKNEWPVLIVPEDIFLGRGIKSVVFTSDLNEVNKIPVQQLYEFLDALPGKLYVLNVEAKSPEKLSPEKEKSVKGLHEILEKYDPAFKYIIGDDVVGEILEFAAQQHASLVITVHHKYGFVSNLFHESITKKLADKASIPLLSLPGLI
jgi:nucleotide-binding universal stress UspA family protein